MKIIRVLSLASALLAAVSAPAFAGVTIVSPKAGESVSTSFTLSANASGCSNQQVGTMGYSWDNSSNTVTSSGNSISKSISAPSSGTHTVHVKAWGLSGASCIADVTVSVNGPVMMTAGTSSAMSAPSTATAVSSIDAAGSWKARHDPGTPGTSSGSMSMVSSPSKSGNARRFVTSYTKYGGERYSASMADNTSATNFLYDGWIFLHNTAKTVSNIEMDLNQVMANGWTVIFGFQCDHWSGTWDYTANQGTAKAPKDKWIHSAAKCNAATWAQNTWHHIQIRYSRDKYGYVTYQSVALDGKVQTINKRVFSAFALGWAPTILTNFQIDGMAGSGTSTVYLDKLTISRW